MSSIDSVTGSSVYTGLDFASFNIDSAFMLAMLERLNSLNADLRAQIDEIKQRNTLKKLWNEKLQQLNDLMTKVAAAGKNSNEKVSVDVPLDELPFKDYTLTVGPDGEPRLTPTDCSYDNMMTTNYVYQYTVGGVVKTTSEQDFAKVKNETGCTEANPVGPRGEFIGYRLSISADMLKSQIDNVRSKIDSLNTDGELATLRLNDLVSKTQLATEQTSKISQKRHETAASVIKNI
jgi:hypothetical protein